ncbi:hypothetical protein J5U22_01699 [Saccharolobus shibatae]|uniref:Uncharacterized protein n=1 Tax=Saccharolobus shibatae TaxID=2286 RepID=A0A8F5C0Z9_9CREN|nr:hypothetical protein J5U22_01699 [Saccharolobus shibatae]
MSSLWIYGKEFFQFYSRLTGPLEKVIEFYIESFQFYSRLT